MNVKRVLVCGPRMPEHDREGGSRRIYHLLRSFLKFGWSVSYLAEDAIGQERYAEMLRHMGIASYDHTDQREQLIAHGQFDLAMLEFWYTAEALLPAFRRLSPGTRVVVDSVDLHFLRECRRVFAARQPHAIQLLLDGKYGRDMVREVNTYALADAVMTVSEKEARLVNDLLGRPALAQAVPDMETVEPSPVRPPDRRGLLFVANFRHPPNVQAVRYLCREVLPLVDPDLLITHPTYIVGNALEAATCWSPATIPNIWPIGWVPSLTPYLHSARVSVVPLLHGAGTKRKLVQSLMAGTPSVSTSVGLEGFDLVPGLHVLLGDNPRSFADGVTELLRNDAVWDRLAGAGRAWAIGNHGPEVVHERLRLFLNDLFSPEPSGGSPCGVGAIKA